MRLYWFLAALFFATLLCGIHLYALVHFLYWKISWLDVPMHLLGGFAIATFLAAFLNSPYRISFFVLSFVAIALGWEVFEFIIGAPQPSDYALDTIFDLINDSVGAITVFLFARTSLWRLAPLV